MILAIDTTDRVTYVAAEHAGVREVYEAARGKATEVLMPEIVRLCTRFATRPTRIGVVTGPGSFTGIRVGIATAQGLAAAWDVPVYGFTRFACLAGVVGDGRLALAPNRHGAVVQEIRAGACTDAPALVAMDALGDFNDLVAQAPLDGLAARLLTAQPVTGCLDLTAAATEAPAPVTPCYVRPADAVAGTTLIARLLGSD